LLYKKEALLEARKNDAEKLVSLVQKGFESGEFSKPVFDKAQIYSIGIQTDWQKTLSEIEVQKQILWQLAGDKTTEGIVFEYPVHWELPPLDSLLANLSEQNPDLRMAKLSIQKSEVVKTNQRMNSLPSFEAGYRSESILNQQLKGFHAGMAIPLWQNRNMLRYARLNIETSKANFSQQESELTANLSAVYFEAKALKDSYEQMKQIIDEEQVSESSLELLQSGQISFSQYYIDVDFIWESQYEFFQNENAYFRLLSLLKTFE